MVETVTEQRRKRGPLIRDIVARGEGGGFPRMRAKPHFTPYEARMRLMEELRDRPPEFQARSLRRRLTKLDRALTDDEAYALDRAFNAWLLFEGKSKSVNPMGQGGGDGEAKAPLNDRELAEAGAFQEMRKRLAKIWQIGLAAMFSAMSPWAMHPLPFSDSNIAFLRSLAKAIKKAYRTKTELA